MQQKPLSPHLAIYKAQTNSVLSILHRITGISLFFGLCLILMLFIMYVQSYLVLDVCLKVNKICPCISSFLGSFFGKIVLFLWLYTLFYHLFFGIRHLLFDCGMALEICSAEVTGWIFLFLSIASTAFCYCVYAC